MQVQHEAGEALEREVRRQLTQLLYRNAGVAVVVNVVTAALLAWVNASMHAEARLALAWWLSVSMAAVARFALGHRFRAAPASADSADRWRRRYVVATAVIAALWGLGAAAFLWNAPDAARLFTGLLTAGLVAGAATVLAPVLLAFHLFMLLISVPMLAVILAQADAPIHFGFAFIIMVMVGAMYSGSRYLHDTIVASIRLGLEKAGMVQVLEEATAAAESANRAKSAFLATMSHELRTPLNGILGMAQVLMIDHRLSDAQRMEYARTINSSGQTLLAILNDVLDISRIEAGRMELAPTPFEPTALIADTVSAFMPLAAAKGLTLTHHWQGPPGRGYEGDVIRLRQMLSNLLNNAIKFTRAGFVRVEVSEQAARDGEAQIEFTVSDSGIGIAPEVQARLFQPFTQADSSTTREFGGSGLGLSIVRRLALLMDGEVGVHSAPGEGARFWFRVRLRIDPQARTGATGDGPSAQSMTPAVEAVPTRAGLTVLAVDDNAVNRKVAQMMLSRLGLKAVCLEHGQQCLDALHEGLQPGFILMDVQMPVMDGLTATERIRAWERATGRVPVPIVALTGGAFDDDIQRCLDAGMNDFLAKPLDFRQLEAVVTRWRD